MYVIDAYTRMTVRQSTVSSVAMCIYGVWIQPVCFSWDPIKSDLTFRTRGFDFAAAARIFAGFTLEGVDGRQEYGEVRVVAGGVVDGLVFTMVHTDREDRRETVTRRIISARRSNRDERQRYEEATAAEEDRRRAH